MEVEVELKQIGEAESKEDVEAINGVIAKTKSGSCGFPSIARFLFYGSYREYHDPKKVFENH